MRVLSGRARILWIELYSWVASPPGKSARAVPPSGIKSVSPTNAASPITCVIQAGVCPGVCKTEAVIPPMEYWLPSENRKSNWLPSRWKAVPALKILPKTSWTSTICLAIPILPPSCCWIYGAADRWSAWTWVSISHSTDSFWFSTYSMISSTWV